MARSDKVVIFDFDGTLADVAEVIRDLYGEEAPKRGWPELTDADYKRLRKGTLKQAMQWVGIRPWQLPRLFREGRSRFHSKITRVKLFVGITKLINDLENDGFKLYILSSNSVETIHKILQKNGVDKSVRVLNRPALFGKSLSIKRLVARNRYRKNNVWMIGDEVRDLEAATKAGVNSIAVSWGLQDESILRQCQPDTVAKKPSDIYKYLTRNAR